MDLTTWYLVAPLSLLQGRRHRSLPRGKTRKLNKIGHSSGFRDFRARARSDIPGNSYTMSLVDFSRAQPAGKFFTLLFRADRQNSETRLRLIAAAVSDLTSITRLEAIEIAGLGIRQQYQICLTMDSMAIFIVKHICRRDTMDLNGEFTEKAHVKRIIGGVYANSTRRS